MILMDREEKICAFVIVIIIIAIVGYFGYNFVKDYRESEKEKEARAKLFIEDGDKITFECTGIIGDSNKIFYTTEASKAENPDLLKTVNFLFLSDDPQTAVVGEELSSLFNKGFTEKIYNLQIGDEVTFKVTPDKGYGWPNESLIRKIPINDVVPLYEKVPTESFQLTYNPEDIPLYIGQRYVHPYWNWPIELVEINNDTIKYRNDPSIDFEITVLPWPAEITGISEKDNKLFLTHKPDKTTLHSTLDPLELLEYDSSFNDIQTVQTDLNIGFVDGIIINVDDDYITIDFNDERAGKTLYYEVKILNIEKA